MAIDTFMHLDPNGKDFAIESRQDVEPILEHNKRLRSMEQRSDWGRHIASIPNVIMTRWLNEEWERGNITIKAFGPEMDALVERKLQDPEWAFLRVDSKNMLHTGWSGTDYSDWPADGESGTDYSDWPADGEY